MAVIKRQVRRKQPFPVHRIRANIPRPFEQSLVLDTARQALKQAERLVSYLEQNGLEEPNFSSNSPAHPENSDYDEIRIDLTQAAQDLTLLANGPLQWIRTFCCCHHDLAAWQVALRFHYFTIVPLDGPISVKDMAAQAHMDEDRLRRVMKFLSTQRCFQEVADDQFEHTALSAFIARNKDIEQCFAFEYFLSHSYTRVLWGNKH